MKAPDLGKMIGPLPLGGWLAAGGAGLAIAFYLRRHGGVSAADAAAAPTPPASPDLSNAGGVVALPGGGSSSSGGDTATTPAITSNDEWGRAAKRTLLARGFDPLVVEGAINDYLNGNPLDVREQAALAIALQLIGPPPNAVPGLSTQPTPVTSVPNPAGKQLRRWLGAGGQAGQAAPDVVASVWRHDGRGGYTVNASKNVRPFAPQGYKMPPMISWGPTGWAKAARLGRIVSIELAANDLSGKITDSSGNSASFTIPPAKGNVA